MAYFLQYKQLKIFGGESIMASNVRRWSRHNCRMNFINIMLTHYNGRRENCRWTFCKISASFRWGSFSLTCCTSTKRVGGIYIIGGDDVYTRPDFIEANSFWVEIEADLVIIADFMEADSLDFDWLEEHNSKGKRSRLIGELKLSNYRI